MTQSKKRSGHTADICTAVLMLACKLAPSSSILQQPATADVLLTARQDNMEVEH